MSGAEAFALRAVLAVDSENSDALAHWRTIAFVDSHRSGMIVYKEKNSYGFDTTKVHSRV
jgi:hypothetical protein